MKSVLLWIFLMGLPWQTSAIPGMRLQSREFKDASYPNCNWDGAKILNSTFKKVNLSGCSFRGAYILQSFFEEVNFKGANFDGAVILLSRFKDNSFDESTYFPPEFENELCCQK